MHVTMPNFTDPADKGGPKLTAIGKIDFVGVGVQDGTGRMVVLPFKSLAAYGDGSKPLDSAIEYRAGDGVIPPLYGSNGQPGLMDDPTFAQAWGTIGFILLGYVAAHHGGTVVTP